MSPPGDNWDFLSHLSAVETKPVVTTGNNMPNDSTYMPYSSRSPCDELTPLKGILKSGGARDDHQKVVCFSGPVVDKEQEEKDKHPYYPPGKQPHFNEEEDFCARYREPVRNTLSTFV